MVAYENKYKLDRLSKAKQDLLSAWLSKRGHAANRNIKCLRANKAVLSFSQQRLWFLEQLIPDNSVLYSMHDAVRIHGHVDHMAIEFALRQIIGRHEILRSSFVYENDTLIQHIHPHVDFKLDSEDCAGFLNAEQVAIEMAIAELKVPFDMQILPLFRAKIIKIKENDCILLWNMHHSISDGWSLGIIIKELLDIVTHYKAGSNLETMLPELSIQFADFAVWQREHVNSREYAADLDFWVKNLSGPLPVLDIPGDFPRPEITSYAGDSYNYTYPLELLLHAKSTAINSSVTLFTLLLSVYYICLHLYSGAEDILVGIPVAGRPIPQLYDLIGFFSNTVVVRSSITGGMVYKEFLQQIKRQVLDAFLHQDVPFDIVVDAINPNRSANRTPVFQTMFVLQNEPMPEFNASGIKITPIQLHNGTSKFDILFNAMETPSGLRIHVEYNSDVYNLDTIQRFVSRYQLILQSVVSNPDQLIDSIPYLDNQERAVILHEFNNTKIDYNKLVPLRFVHEMIEEQSRLNGNLTAVHYEACALSYHELNICANQIARCLINLGVKSREVCAIYTPNRLELLPILLAVIKIGACYLPIDIGYPEARVNYMLDDSKAKFVISHTLLDSKTQDVICLLIDDLLKQSTNFDTSNINTIVDKRDPVYIMYTSGSTGKPKAAINNHLGISNRLLWMRDNMMITKQDVILCKTPLSFDVSVWELFLPLISSATLVLSRSGTNKDIVETVNLVNHYGISIIYFIPSMLNIFLSTKLATTCRSLRLFVCSGDVLPIELVHKFKQCFNAKLYNLYGPTECAIDVTCLDCDDIASRGIVSIGKPIANTQIYILDSNLQLLPIGVYGEICIGGDNVGNGYLNNTTATEGKFVFCKYADTFVYKTGDRGRFLSDGSIEFRGRSDYQVKLRGMRIELQEIEKTILDCGRVSNAVVKVINEESDPQLCAFIQPEIDTYKQWHKESVTQWTAVFDETYQASNNDFMARNFIGWNSSYTDQPIAIGDMNKWLDATLDKLKTRTFRRVLEIGCGCGLILLNLASDCDIYVGTDISTNALDYTNHVATVMGFGDKVVLLNCHANELERVVEHGPFDLIILNSVIQYFSSYEYLIDVLRACAKLLSENGAIFLGDIRNYQLFDQFVMSIACAKSPNDSLKDLKQQYDNLHHADPEIMFDPIFFGFIPQVIDAISDVCVTMRTEDTDNELSKYRYDVWLYGPNLSRKINLSQDLEIIDWSQGVEFENLIDIMHSTNQIGVCITNIPNRRILKDVLAVKTIAQADDNLLVKQLLQTVNDEVRSINGIDPGAIYQNYKDSYKIILTYAEAVGYFNVAVIPLFGEECQIIDSCLDKVLNVHEYLNLYCRSGSDVQHKVIKDVQDKLLLVLPDYMVPSRYVVINTMPTLPNGKIDRNALKSPILSSIHTNDIQYTKRSDGITVGSSVEKLVVQIWNEVLNLDARALDDNFFECGGTSLASARLMLKLHDLLGINMPLRYLFDHPRLADVIMYANGSQLEPSKDNSWTTMLADIDLINSLSKKFDAICNDQNCLLITGSTGFVGAYLLRDLLTYTTANIICLIRSTDSRTALSRLHRVFVGYMLDPNIINTRVQVIAGDISLPKFGLSLELYEQIAHSVDIIYHCASEVNFVSSYWQLRDSNVTGTLNVLQFALDLKIKYVHYISTIHVLHDLDSTNKTALSESDMPVNGNKLDMGYLKTKWVAENMMIKARSLGIPINIYRLGRVSGDTVNGACQTGDFYWNMVRVCLQLGCFPEGNFEDTMIPVDMVSRSIAYMSIKSSINSMYHLVGDTRVSLDILLDALISVGYNVYAMPTDEWKNFALSRADHADERASSMASFIFNVNHNEGEHLGFSSADTRKRLYENGLDKLVDVDIDLLKKYIGFFINNGFFKSPDNKC